METGPLLARLDVARLRRFLVRPGARVSAGGGRGSAASLAADRAQRRGAGELIRPVQFIGVIPADIAREQAR
jgi:hypothetical protein